jgi:hypothetical protein
MVILMSSAHGIARGIAERNLSWQAITSRDATLKIVKNQLLGYWPAELCVIRIFEWPALASASAKSNTCDARSIRYPDWRP